MLFQVVLTSNYHDILTDVLKWKTSWNTQEGRLYPVTFHHVFFDLPFLVQEPALTTTASRRNAFSLTVALSAGGWAWGDLFWDDGDSLDTYELGNYCYITFIAGQVGQRRVMCICKWKADKRWFEFYYCATCVKSLFMNLLTLLPRQSQIVSDPLRLNGALDGLVLGGLRVFGVPSPPRYVLANGDKVRDFTYRSDTKVSSV